MSEQVIAIVAPLAERPDVVRVVVSDREGLLIGGLNGKATSGTIRDEETSDDQWSAFVAQFVTDAAQQLKNLTLSQPTDMVVHGTRDSLIITWLHVGWLITRVSPTTDWQSLFATIRTVQSRFDEVTGEPG
jgi:predicted regulator of Ras-like GTPase activity (Roadblock/LC7/MglB family)